MDAGRKNQWNKATVGMINQQGELVDTYLPRKCEFTNRIISARDRASIQMNVAHVDENGQCTGQKTSVVLSGFIRATGKGPASLEKILYEKEILPIRN